MWNVAIVNKQTVLMEDSGETFCHNMDWGLLYDVAERLNGFQTLYADPVYNDKVNHLVRQVENEFRDRTIKAYALEQGRQEALDAFHKNSTPCHIGSLDGDEIGTVTFHHEPADPSVGIGAYSYFELTLNSNFTIQRIDVQRILADATEWANKKKAEGWTQKDFVDGLKRFFEDMN